MGWKSVGEAGVSAGWRQKVADQVAHRAGARLPVDARQVRALIGLAFIALSARYLARTVRRALRA